MKKTHIGYGLLLIPIITMSVYGMNAGYRELNLNHAESSWNRSNDTISRLESELAVERKYELENFCYLVDTKKEYDRQISNESLARYTADCLGE